MRSRLFVVLASAACTAPFFAHADIATMPPQAFANNAGPSINFLDQSSRFALHNSHSERLRRFARSEAAEQTAAANALVAWVESTTPEPTVSVPNPPPAPSIGTFAAVPFRAIASTSAVLADGLEGGIHEGRSVAIDHSPETTVPVLIPKSFPAEAEDLSSLSRLHGQAFDDLYKTAQLNALLQLSTVYTAYIEHGGDVALKAIAIRELPKVNIRITEVKAL